MLRQEEDWYAQNLIRIDGEVLTKLRIATAVAHCKVRIVERCDNGREKNLVYWQYGTRPVKGLLRSTESLSTSSNPKSCDSRSTNPSSLLVSTSSPTSISVSGSAVEVTHPRSMPSVKPSQSQSSHTTRSLSMSTAKMPSSKPSYSTTEHCWLPITDVASLRSLEVGQVYSEDAGGMLTWCTRSRSKSQIPKVVPLRGGYVLGLGLGERFLEHLQRMGCFTCWL